MTPGGPPSAARVDFGITNGSGPATLDAALAKAWDGFGGYLRCEVCKRCEPLGDPVEHARVSGWPRCCGYTMRWWTQRQIDAGEVPA